jgi:hypothetical protein
MKYLQTLILLGLIVGMLGCDGNDIQVNNLASASVRFHFRGEEYIVNSGESVSITDIPSASYEYTTVYSIPYWADAWDADTGLAGFMHFYAKSTSYLLEYTSASSVEVEESQRDSLVVLTDTSYILTYTVYDTVWTYHIGATKTSSHPKSTNPTSAE